MNERVRLLRQVQICGFAITEAALYLDGHPKNKQALKYYKKYSELKEKAVAEYEEKFGPLMLDSNKDENEWHWTDNPWPWESEE